MTKQKGIAAKAKGKISVLLMFAILISSFLPQFTYYAAESIEAVNLLAEENLSPGVHYTEEDIVNYREKEGHRVRFNHLVIDPENDDIKIISAKAQDTVNAMETIGMQAQREILKGNNVVAGVNASSYDMDYGINSGIQVKDGYIITSQPYNNFTKVTPVFYVDENGTPDIGPLRVTGDIRISTPSGISAAVSTSSGISAQGVSEEGGYYSEVPIINRNNFSGISNEVTRVYTSSITRNHKLSHGAGTKPDQQAYALIRLQELDGYLKAGMVYTGTVLEIYEDDGFEIPSDCIVYAGYADRAEEIMALKPGSDVTYECHLYTGDFTEEDGVLTDRGEQNDSVVNAVNGFHSLIRDGAIDWDVVNNQGTDNNSRTAIGITADKKIHVIAAAKPSTYFNDSIGTSFKDLSDYMFNELGCVEALNLDGGGSTEMIARRAGSDDVVTVSYPSDGNSRSVSNSLFFLSQAPRSSTVGQVVVDSSLKIYKGSRNQFSVRLADINGNAMPAEGRQITWEAEYGVIDEDGKYIAPDEAVEDIVTATVEGVSGSAQVLVVDAEGIAEIDISPSGTVSLSNGDIRQFEFIAYDNTKKHIIIDPALAAWSITGSAIGTLEDGLLAVTSETGEAVLISQFLDRTYSVNIIVGLEEQVIDDFESYPIEGYYIGSYMYGRKTQFGGVSQMLGLETRDMENSRVKNGDKSFRMTYDTSMWAWDNTNKKRTTNGTMNMIPLWDDNSDYAENGNWTESLRVEMERDYTAKAMPKKFSMWIYSGDEDNDGISDNEDCMLTTVFKANCTGPGTGTNKSLNLTGSINWIGWKYVEAEIPQDWPMPIVFNYFWASNTNRTLAPEQNYSTDLLVDDLKFLYTDTEHDFSGPVFSQTTPEAGGYYKDSMEFSTVITDKMSGVDASAISVQVNGQPFRDYSFNPQDGKLDFRLENLQDKENYRIIIKVKDNIGNESVPYIDNTYTVDLTPDTEGPIIDEVTPTSDVGVQIPRPRINFNLTDTKGEVDSETILVKLNGESAPVYYDKETGWGYALPEKDLNSGIYELTIDACDILGNKMETYTDTLTVSPISQPADPDNYKITVIPDTQGNTYSERIFGRAAEDGSDIVIHLGDIVDGASQQEYDDAKEYVNMLNKPFFVMAGNHEGVNGNLDLFYKTFGSPTYHFRYGNSLIIMLNSAYGQSVNYTDSTQYHYLEELLKENNLPNVYVFNHVVTRDDFSTEHNMSEAEAERFEGIMTAYKAEHPEYNVNVLFGHLHTLHNWQVGGVNYIIGGNAAAKGYVSSEQGNLLGSGMITVKGGKGQYEFVPLLTKVYIKNDALIGNTLKAAEGAKVQLDLYGDFREYPANYMAQLNSHELVGISWHSSDEEVAAVDDNGLLAVKGSGTANITAVSGGKTHTITVQTIDPSEADIVSISLSLPERVKVGKDIVPTVRATEIYGSVFVLDSKTVNFSFKNGLMTSNEDGTITATAKGNETVTAEYKGFTSSADITIVKKSSSGDGGNNSGSKEPDPKEDKPEITYNEGGEATVSEDGTLTIIPAEGYVIKDVLLNGKSVGQQTTLTNLKPTDDVQVIFEKSEKTEEENDQHIEFNDISDHWAKDAILYVTGKGYFKGISENSFGPDISMSRAMFVTVLYRMEGEPGSSASIFTDVAGDAYYSYAVAWAFQHNIVNGVSSASYNPDGYITREQIAAMLVRYLELKGIKLENSGKTPGFADDAQISEYAKDGIVKLSQAGILKGKENNRFDPHGVATRAEIAAILLRIAETFSLEI